MIFFVPEATPVRVAGVLQTLQATGPISASRLEFLLSPPSLRKGENRPALIANLLRFMESLDLIELLRDDGRYRLHPSFREGTSLDYEGTLRLLAHRLVGRPREISEGDETEQFALLVAWYLDQPLTKLPNSASELNTRWEKMNEARVPPLTDERFRHFLEWSKSLGLLTPLSIGRKEPLILIAVNPVPFLRRQLPTLMPPGEALSAPDWLKTLSDAFPVFDGGSAREKIRKSEDQILSPSLTFALQQLSESKFLTIEDRKDAPRLRLRLGRHEQSFSHVTLTQGGVA
jgi:hypothetical protein